MNIGIMADMHLGYRAGRDRGRIREQDVASAWSANVSAVIKDEIDLLLIAGDVFQNPNPSVDARLAWQRGVRRLMEADIPVVAIPGNHDGSAHELKSLVSSGFVTEKHLAVADKEQTVIRRGVRIQTLPYRVGAAGSFRPDLKERGWVSVLLAHARIDSPTLPFYYRKGGLPIEDWLGDCYDLIAAGDYHDYWTHDEDRAVAVYPGSTEYTRSNVWSEAGKDKGFAVYNTVTRTVRHRKVRLLRKVVDINAKPTPDGVNEALAELLAQPHPAWFPVARVKAVGFDMNLRSMIDPALIRRVHARSPHFHLDLRAREREATLAPASRMPLLDFAKNWLDDGPAEKLAMEEILTALENTT